MSEPMATCGRGSAHQDRRPIRPPAPDATNLPPAIVVRDVNLFYDTKQALFDISMDIGAKKVTAFIGPSGCGKSTLLRCLQPDE